MQTNHPSNLQQFQLSNPDINSMQIEQNNANAPQGQEEIDNKSLSHHSDKEQQTQNKNQQQFNQPQSQETKKIQNEDQTLNNIEQEPDIMTQKEIINVSQRPFTQQVQQKQTSPKEPLYDSRQGSVIQKQSCSVLNYQDQPYISFLRTIFDHYSKISYTTGRNMTFQRLQHQTHILTINKFMIWCKQFKITGKVPIMKLMEVFKKSGISHKEMDFPGFVIAVGKISEVMFEGEHRIMDMRTYLGISSENEFREKCRQLHITSSLKPISSSMQMRVKRKQGSSSRLKPQESERAETPKTENRKMKIKSEYIRNKMISHMERYPDVEERNQIQKHLQIQKQRKSNNLKEINSSMKLRQGHSKQYSQVNRYPGTSQNKLQAGRYSRAKSTVDKYKISTVISQAKIEVKKDLKEEKSSIDNKHIKLLRKQKEDAKAQNGFLDKLFGMDEDDEYLSNYEKRQNILNHKKVSEGLSKRIEQIRKIGLK